jgi:hypothetical protein
MIYAISSHKKCFRFSPTILLALDRRRKTASKIDLERERKRKRASERASAMQLPLLQQPDFPREKKKIKIKP